jgi:hypothetical protein
VVDFEILRRQRETAGLDVPPLLYAATDRLPRTRWYLDTLADIIEPAACEHRARRHGGTYWLEAPEILY